MKPVASQWTCGSVAFRTPSRFSRLILAVALLWVGLTSDDSSQQAAPDGQAVVPESITSLRPEVRLRKLHLVRPDLIQYPLAYDIYC